MDIISFQEAKKVKKIIGNPNELKTENKIIVNAINEIIDAEKDYELKVYETLISNVDTNEKRELWISFIKNGFIRGIKCTGQIHTEDFILSLYTKSPANNGKIVYYSAIVNNVLWDIMDIPFSDESGTNNIYVIIENKGPLTTFHLQIFAKKG